MAGDYYLMLDGVKGESVDDKHKGEIDIESFSWGMSNTGSVATGGGLGSGKVNIGDINISKFVDLASPVLMLFCANGKHVEKGKLTVRKAGESPLEYITFDLNDILISGYQTGGSEGSNERPTETVTISFAKVKVEYWTQNAKGAKGDNANFSWDLKKNTKF